MKLVGRSPAPVLLLAVLSGCNGGEATSETVQAGRTDPAAGNTAAPAEPDSTAAAAAAAAPSDGPATRPSATRPARSASADPQQQAAEPDPRLFGTWVAEDVDTTIGQATVKLVFERRGPVHILAWSELPLVGQVRDRQAPFTVTDHTIHSDALRGGTTVNYHFDDQGRLVIEYKDGKTVTFHNAGGS